MNRTEPETKPIGIERSSGEPGGRRFYYLLFFLSGFPALLYQIVWQRALFTIYGVNVESVTIIVTVFMLGLGLGSLAGGKLSTRKGLHLLLAFGLIELGVGVYGAMSLSLFHRVASYTAGSSLPATGLLTFVLLLIPTLLMGSTLPLLVAHLVRQTGNVGESVGTLYSVNTLGSATACFAAALFIMRTLGESGSVRLAALINVAVGGSALLLQWRTSSRPRAPSIPEAPCDPVSPLRISFGLAMLLSGAVGFIALAYEIIWYRLYSFASGGAAPSFAKLLAFYLFGIAYGAFVVGDKCRKKLGDDPNQALKTTATIVIWANIASFLVGPALGFSAKYVPYDVTFPLVFLAASLLGAAFPLLSHAAIDPRNKAGRLLSYLYLCNIAGSALGSFLVGFVVMDHYSTKTTSSFLLLLGLTVAAAIAVLSRPIVFRSALLVGISVSVLLIGCSDLLFSRIYERMLFKQRFTAEIKFQHLVENRSGVIAVGQDGSVYGGGVYDGHFNTDPIHDFNGIFRAYAISGLHPKPKNVLIIGLSSGSWAQVVANNPEVERVTIVEINPGYLSLIRQYPAVASLLRNPKVEIFIDDGRRWLVRNPQRRFDFILMNTSYHWRAHASNLLSVEFLKLVRSNLNPGGIDYYNTTWSGEAQLTGATVFPYSLRLANFLAVSDQPFSLDRQLWLTSLRRYHIDGKPIFDLGSKSDLARIAEIVSLPDISHERARGISTESGSGIRERLAGTRVITDDNMGTEWK